MNYFISLFCCFFLLQFDTFTQPSETNVDKVLKIVNDLRARGCKCGSKFMPPVSPLKWNQTLYQVSNGYAHYMFRNNHFDHVSLEGEDLGDRLDKIRYPWERIGENLGVGYNDFYKVLRAWIESPTHCEMLMDPHFTDFGMSKHHEYWVQSFARELSRGTFSFSKH